MAEPASTSYAAESCSAPNAQDHKIIARTQLRERITANRGNYVSADRLTWKSVFRRYGDEGRWPVTESHRLFDPATMGTKCYRYRGSKIPNPWLTAG
jgi:hypothetical protein